MTTAITLYLLATLDAAFSGYRAAAGRNALIEKGRYYRRAMLRGALWGQGSVGVGLLPVLVFLGREPERRAALSTLLVAGHSMLAVYLPYAAVVLGALAARRVASVDLRSLTSTLVFGPLTLARPAVAVLGVALGLLEARRLALVPVAVIGLALMLSIEAALLRSGPSALEPGDQAPLIPG
jgi:hypothetical protein